MRFRRGRWRRWPRRWTQALSRHEGRFRLSFSIRWAGSAPARCTVEVQVAEGERGRDVVTSSIHRARGRFGQPGTRDRSEDRRGRDRHSTCRMCLRSDTRVVCDRARAARDATQKSRPQTSMRQPMHLQLENELCASPWTSNWLHHQPCRQEIELRDAGARRLRQSASVLQGHAEGLRRVEHRSRHARSAAAMIDEADSVELRWPRSASAIRVTAHWQSSKFVQTISSEGRSGRHRQRDRLA